MSRSLLSRPLVYAHRGGAALRPENTIAAFDHGLAVGADGLELDVHLSSDGEVVVHHDATLDRTTGGRGRIADFSADDLARVDAGGGAGIPRLREVLQRYADVPLIIELKANSVALAERTVEELRRANAIERVAVGSFYGRALRTVRALEPALRTGAAQEETRWALYRSWVRWPLGQRPYREFQVPEQSGLTKIVTPGFIDYAHRAGLPVKIWTVNDPADMRRLLTWGADALITDRPDLAVAIVRQVRV